MSCMYNHKLQCFIFTDMITSLNIIYNLKKTQHIDQTHEHSLSLNSVAETIHCRNAFAVSDLHDIITMGVEVSEGHWFWQEKSSPPLPSSQCSDLANELHISTANRVQPG